MHYVRSITGVLSDHLGWHRARLKFMARFTSALLKLTTSNLWEIATVLKADVKEESNYRRIRRFLSDYKVGFAELGRLLTRLFPQRPPYAVAAEASIQGRSRPHGVVLWGNPGERSDGGYRAQWDCLSR